MSNVAVRRSVTVPAVPEQVRVARAFASEVLGESDPHIDVALLLASTAASCRITSNSASLDAETGRAGPAAAAADEDQVQKAHGHEWLPCPAVDAGL